MSVLYMCVFCVARCVLVLHNLADALVCIYIPDAKISYMRE